MREEGGEVGPSRCAFHVPPCHPSGTPSLGGARAPDASARPPPPNTRPEPEGAAAAGEPAGGRRARRGSCRTCQEVRRSPSVRSRAQMWLPASSPHESPRPRATHAVSRTAGSTRWRSLHKIGSTRTAALSSLGAVWSSGPRLQRRPMRTTGRFSVTGAVRGKGRRVSAERCMGVHSLAPARPAVLACFRPSPCAAAPHHCHPSPARLRVHPVTHCAQAPEHFAPLLFRPAPRATSPDAPSSSRPPASSAPGGALALGGMPSRPRCLRRRPRRLTYAGLQPRGHAAPRLSTVKRFHSQLLC